MRDVIDDVRSLGAELVVVGNGKPEHAADFKKDQNLPFNLYVDTDLEAYSAAGLRKGITEAVNLRMIGHSVRAFRKGFRQKKLQGDPWQLGGTFIITPEGKTLFQHTSREDDLARPECEWSGDTPGRAHPQSVSEGPTGEERTRSGAQVVVVELPTTAQQAPGAVIGDRESKEADQSCIWTS